MKNPPSLEDAPYNLDRWTDDPAAGDEAPAPRRQADWPTWLMAAAMLGAGLFAGQKYWAGPVRPAVAVDPSGLRPSVR